MRFVLAIISFVVAASFIGLGIAQKTVFAQPDEVTASVVATDDAPVTVITGEALNAFPRSQFVRYDGGDGSFAAYARTIDIEGWVGDATHTVVGYDAETGELTSTLEEGTEDEVPTPVGSDLWLATFTDKSAITVNVPDDISLMIVSDGIAPAPAEVSVTWPLDNSTPWANTFVVAGGVLLLVGLLLLFWAIAHVRRGRGPRRKSQKMPKLPRPPRYKPIKARTKAIESTSKGRRSITSRIAVLPVVLVGALVLGGCSSDFLAGRVPVAEATSSSDAVAAADDAAPLEVPAVSVAQAERIIADIVSVTTAADAATDPVLAATRLDGPALTLRETNYAARKVDATITAVDAIPDGPVSAVLPQTSDATGEAGSTWPRVVFAVIDDPVLTADGVAKPQVAVMLNQEDARSNYKAEYVVRLQPGVQVPDLAPASIGAGRVVNDTKFLTVAPESIAADYGDILLNDTASPSYDLFEAEGDALREGVGLAFKTTRIETFKRDFGTSTDVFTTLPSEGEVVALATNDSGAIVAVDVNELETITVVDTGAEATANKETAALTGKAKSTKGFAATYGYQILVFVPSATEGGKIVMLGFSQGLTSASELP